ncbi:MAG: hypothetical protein KOO60_09715 [Gemmatimonadales bacterium]|nr:hypothetical protein [Gemmatimonadales bacterium]
MALGSLTNLMFRLPCPITAEFLTPDLSWSFWIASLFILGAGFLWVSSAPSFSNMGLFVALFHVVHALGLLLILIFKWDFGWFPPEFLTIGRLISLLFFAFKEKSAVPAPILVLLGSTAALQVLKINLRVLQIIPETSAAWLALLDTALLLLMAAAFFMLGVFFLKGEDSWPLEEDIDEDMALEEFNNPEHPWNKPK